jgi:pyruvate ferredoxin oxidoreductase alpha subunit
MSQRVLLAIDGMELPPQNAFGDRVVVEQGTDVAALAKRAAQAAAEGERVALVARAADLAAARAELARIAMRGLGIVAHAIAEPGGPGVPSCESGIAPALTLGDLPWGILLAASVGDGLDLSLVARRAAEDSGCPFVVVHERSHAHHAEPVVAPSRELLEALLGGPRPAGYPPPGPTDRAFAERAPFALASAMRELEALTGRRHDVLERVPAADTSIALVGVGALGDSMLADVERQRAAGHDVGAVRVVAWRPFPGARIVKALHRALAITVLENADRPLAANGPLSVQLKAAFADALTWAPDYPGVGRIPRIASGIVSARRELDASDVDAMVHNMLADERGRRTFTIGGDPAAALDGPAVPRTRGSAFALRGIAPRRDVAVAAGELCAVVLASAFGLRTRVAVRALADDEGGGFAFDLVAARERPRGVHAPHALRALVVSDTATLERGNALSRLAPGGLVGVPTRQRAADAVWAEVPPWIKAVAFDRSARVIGWAPASQESGAWLQGAAFVGLALAAAATDRSLTAGRSVDAGVVEREVAEALRRVGADVAAMAEPGGRLARESFEAHVEVPRATIDREDDGVRLGRRDARAGA